MNKSAPGITKNSEKKTRWNAVLEKYALHCWPKTRKSRKKQDWKVFLSYRLCNKRQILQIFWVWHLPHHCLITARQQLDKNKNYMRLPTFARSLKIVKTQRRKMTLCIVDLKTRFFLSRFVVITLSNKVGFIELNHFCHLVHGFSQGCKNTPIFYNLIKLNSLKILYWNLLNL